MTFSETELSYQCIVDINDYDIFDIAQYCAIYKVYHKTV